MNGLREANSDSRYIGSLHPHTMYIAPGVNQKIVVIGLYNERTCMGQT